MIKAVRLPIEVNLLRFSQLLSSQGVAHRITEESGEQVIWVQDEPHAALLKEMLATWSFEQSSSANEASARCRAAPVQSAQYRPKPGSRLHARPGKLYPHRGLSARGPGESIGCAAAARRLSCSTRC